MKVGIPEYGPTISSEPEPEELFCQDALINGNSTSGQILSAQMKRHGRARKKKR
jgi:hypothetical protein